MRSKPIFTKSQRISHAMAAHLCLVKHARTDEQRKKLIAIFARKWR